MTHSRSNTLSFRDPSSLQRGNKHTWEIMKSCGVRAFLGPRFEIYKDLCNSRIWRLDFQIRREVFQAFYFVALLLSSRPCYLLRLMVC